MAASERKLQLLDFEKPLAELESRIDEIRALSEQNGVDVADQVGQLEARAEQLRQEIFSSLTPMQELQLARHPRRPSTLDYIHTLSEEWMELHGDRRGHDDPAMVGGVGRIDGQPVLMLGHQKGRDTKDNVARNFGMPFPSGYRKALRLMDHANRFNLPIISFIDTPAAWAGLEAEQYGQGEAIALNLREMFRLEVPIICAVIGEGGSGGALGIGVGDRVMMFEHSIYSVAPPEACAAILWRDAQQGPQAAEALKITATDLLELGIIDQILSEPLGGAHTDPTAAAETLKANILVALEELWQLEPQERRQKRYHKFRNMGVFSQVG
ncbi:MAG: acetyl-CoA carboxylase carboxyltransferase subunit alpha [Acaryochloridaceae cyanobacterium SU_2_1]|nr:acetyl-CoA carboxylase carboxyltransferase subunit alpha [Acaryochloridaceae cyanobacterium SU_2_1]